MNNLKMRNKLLVMFIITGLIPLLVVSAIAFFESRKLLEHAIFNEIQLFGEMTENRIETYMESNRMAGHTLADTPQIYNAVEEYRTFGAGSPEWEAAYQGLEDFIPAYAERFEFLSVYIINEQGRGIYSSGEYKNQLEGADYSGRDYFRTAITGTQNFSEFMYSDIINEHFIAVATPLRNPITGNIIGTVNGLLPLPAIQEMLQEEIEHIGQSGDIYLIDGDGLLFTNTRLGDYASGAAFVERVTTHAQEELKSHIAAGELDFHGVGIYKDYLGNNVLGSYSIIEVGGTSLGLVVEVDEAEALVGTITMRNRVLLLVGIALVLGIGMALYFASFISKPIRATVEMSQTVAGLDLTQNMPQNLTKRQDENGEMAGALQSIIQSLREIIKNINSSAHALAASSQEMAASSEEVNAATEEISTSITQVAGDADRQNDNVIEASQALIQLSSLVQLAQDKASEVNQTSISAMETAQTGRDKVKDTVKAIETIKEKSQGTSEVVNDLSKLSTKIGEIITTINGIAEQTNLLALNAAIEAARAGEQGRGFAVVAEEVRKLAEESNKGANQIASLVSEMMSQTEKAVASMDFGLLAVNDGVKVVNETDMAFAEIIEAVRHTVNNIKEIVDITKDEVATSDQVVELINKVASITESTAANSEEVSAATEEQSATVENLASAAEEISAMSNDLEALVRRFKV